MKNKLNNKVSVNLEKMFDENILNILDNNYYENYIITKMLGNKFENFCDFLEINGFGEKIEMFKFLNDINLRNGEGKLYKENVNSILIDYIEKIFLNKNLNSKYNFKLGGGTGLTLMGAINRLSTDIDIFIEESQISNFRNDLQSVLGINLSKRSSNDGYSTSITEDFKIELVPTTKNEYITIDGIKFSPLEETISNKLNAILEREQYRDVYDLAYLALNNNSIFERISEIHKKRFFLFEGYIKSDKKLNMVLKNQEFDYSLINAFYKKIKS